MTTVVIGSNGNAVITLSRQTVTAIANNRPRTVTGTGMGAQGPQGIPGTSGGTISPINFSWGDASSAIYTASDAGRITTIRVVITTAFNGTGAALSLGSVGSPEAAMPQSEIEPTTEAEFEVTSDYVMAAGASLFFTITPGGGASQGAGVIYLTYLPD